MALIDSEEALHLLATAYYRSGKPSRAYSVLRMHGHNSPQLKYLMAKCCYDLGKLDEAETAITGGSVLKAKQIDEIVTEFGSIACFALQLLGLICAKTERMTRATEALCRSLKLNPFLWNSFATLCDHGDKLDPTKVFKLDSLENFTHIHGSTVYSLFNAESTATQNCGDLSVNSNKLSNVSMNTPINENIHQSTQLINHTPTIHSQQQTQNIPTHINTQNTLGTNLSLLTPNIQQSISLVSISTPIQQSLAGINTPISINSSFSEALDSLDVPKVKKIVRFQRFHGNNPNISPISPSFGVLPLELSNQWSESEVTNSSVAFLTPSPLSLSQLDSQSNNKLHMNIGKRILYRNPKDSPLVINKPAVFAPAGNNSNFQSSPTGQAYVRRSSRLFGNSSSVKENNKNRFVAPKSPARKTKTRSNKNQTNLAELNEKNKSENHDIISTSEKTLADKPCTISLNLAQQAISIQKHCADGLMTLMKDIGGAYLQLSQYNCKKAIELFSALPSQHYQTGWVLSHLAKAYFEMNDYEESIRKNPIHLNLMEYYSTALWHLQKEVQLSSLAQDLVEVDRDAPQSWCATGNCFSIQKEHEAAIKFFSRAIQVDPGFSYAYTLLGHEYLATEELDRALSCYRSAVRIDPRHYNAWLNIQLIIFALCIYSRYGIGLVLFKQERFTQAEWYFKKAVNIHPQCAVLLCHVAVVEHTLQKSNAALATLSKALSIDPCNPLCKYHRASILHAMDRYQEALEELLQLKEIIPKEANVYFLLGKVYKRLGDTHLALMNFSWAMDLDPKDANNQFKEAIDPAINFPADGDDNTNNNPQENMTSEANSSLMAAESSQESLILEPSSDNGLSLIEEHPLSTSLSTSILGPSSGVSVGSSGVNIPNSSSSISADLTSGVLVSSSSFGFLSHSSSPIITAPSSSGINTSAGGDNGNNCYSSVNSHPGSSSLVRNRFNIPCSRISPNSGTSSVGRISLSGSGSGSLSSPLYGSHNATASPHQQLVGASSSPHGISSSGSGSNNLSSSSNIDSNNSISNLNSLGQRSGYVNAYMSSHNQVDQSHRHHQPQVDSETITEDNASEDIL
ncbi:Cell division cycle protein 27-like protein [Armadillidium nasatum]|uniref:Cell division cycle protein 27 homolog n=1 Tax=Armadillidium nasatum TaxID=96803 RepID=A0A5N5SN08_9CRUS|nr:Cell division cycle protein 27-like protein [Armadillidium nasatum]